METGRPAFDIGISGPGGRGHRAVCHYDNDE